MPPQPLQQQIRRIILTASVAAVTATGAWYGADLKATQERKKEVTALRQTMPVDRISQLETTRAGLMIRKTGLERKIRQLEGRRLGLPTTEGEGGRERR